MADKNDKKRDPLYVGRIKTDLYWGQIFYRKNDNYQRPCTLIVVLTFPGNQVGFKLRGPDDEIYEVHDFEVTTEPDEELRKKSEEADDDTDD